MTNYEQMIFVSSRPLIDSVRAKMRSYDAAGLIDEGLFYDWIHEILNYLKISAYNPQMYIVEVKNHKAPLPVNFERVHAGYSLFPRFDRNQRYFLGGSKITVEFEVDGVSTPVEPLAELSGEHDLVKKYFLDNSELDLRFANPKLIRLSPQTPLEYIDDQSLSVYTTATDEFYINKNLKLIQTNFNGWMMLQYYGYPIEEATGLPAVPEEPIIQKAIISYLVKNLLEEWWLNASVPDLERKLAHFKNEHDEAMRDTITYVKTPGFESSLRMARNRRSMSDRYQLNTKQYW